LEEKKKHYFHTMKANKGPKQPCTFIVLTKLHFWVKNNPFNVLNVCALINVYM